MTKGDADIMKLILLTLILLAFNSLSNISKLSSKEESISFIYVMCTEYKDLLMLLSVSRLHMNFAEDRDLSDMSLRIKFLICGLLENNKL